MQIADEPTATGCRDVYSVPGPVGEIVVQRHSDGTVEIIEADDRIAIAPGLLLVEPRDPALMDISWPRVTFVGHLVYRIVSFDLGARAFIAEKEEGSDAEGS